MTSKWSPSTSLSSHTPCGTRHSQSRRCVHPLWCTRTTSPYSRSGGAPCSTRTRSSVSTSQDRIAVLIPPLELDCVRLFLDERSTTEATARLQSGKALLGSASAPFDPNKNTRERPAYDKATGKRPPWHAALDNCRYCNGKHYNNSCHMLRENGGNEVR